MANQKAIMCKVLVFVLVFFCWFQSSGRVEAAPLENVIAKLHNVYPGYYDQVDTLCYSCTNPEKVQALAMKKDASSTSYTFIIYSFENISIRRGVNTTQYLSDGTVKNVSDSYSNVNATALTLNNGKKVYYLAYHEFYAYDEPTWDREIEFYCDLYYYSNPSPSQALLYILNNLEPSEKYWGDYTPDWSTSEYDQFLKIENFQASIEDEQLYMTWDPSDFPEGEREFHYIKFRFKQRHPGTQESGNRRSYVPKEYYIQYKELCGRIPISDLDLSEGYILSSLQATPYYHLSDNPEWQLYHGDTTYVYFDDDGNSTNPIIIDTDVDPDVEEEEVPRTILGSIQNFFSNFWRNITNTAKAAVVPESEDLLGLLDEMNNWFGDRFGFIWYPFDLAIDIVAAFGLGEPDNKITVPALTLNMFGGVQLWESFEIDLDPVGFLQYVKFFTSVLMCCGTVSLAIRKWDEWIGGRNT